MKNEDSIVVQSSDKIIPHTALPSESIVLDGEKRQRMIQLIRQVPAILEVVKKLSEGKTYKAYISPDILDRINNGSAKFAHRDNGLLGANILDAETGKIIHNASLMEVTPDLLSSLIQLGIQQTLADIVHRLEVLDEKITDVLQGQINDRLAEVESGIHIYEQAIVASNPDIRRELTVSAIQKLNDGRNKLIKSTDFSFIDELPRNELGMLFDKRLDIPKYVQSKAERVWLSAHAILRASRYLVMAYSDLNEPDSLRVSLEQVEKDVKVFQDKTGEIVRWLSPTSDLHENLTIISQGVLPRIKDLDEISQKSMVVEFQPEEILLIEGG